jgi:hypothetical protein
MPERTRLPLRQSTPIYAFPRVSRKSGQAHCPCPAEVAAARHRSRSASRHIQAIDRARPDRPVSRRVDQRKRNQRSVLLRDCVRVTGVCCARPRIRESRPIEACVAAARTRANSAAFLLPSSPPGSAASEPIPSISRPRPASDFPHGAVRVPAASCPASRRRFSGYANDARAGTFPSVPAAGVYEKTAKTFCTSVSM